MKKQYLLYIILFMFTSCFYTFKHRFPPEKFFEEELLPLAKAIYDNKPKEVKKFISSNGIDINTAAQKSGYTLLLYAINTESKAVVKELLKIGANPNLVSDTKVYENPNSDEYYIRKRYPLSDAAYDGDLFYAKILLEYRANPNLGSPLQIAILNCPEKSLIHMIDLLLNSGADINNQNARGQTPIYTAASAARFDLVNYLLDREADPMIKSKTEKNVVTYLKYFYRKYENKETFKRVYQPTLDRLKARGIIVDFEEDVKDEAEEEK